MFVFLYIVATMPDDYSPQAESVTFGINSMESDTECVRVIIVDDDIVEEAETFTVVLETASYMEVETDESLSSLVVTIIDDDGNVTLYCRFYVYETILLPCFHIYYCRGIKPKSLLMAHITIIFSQQWFIYNSCFDLGACIGLTSMNLTVDEGDEEIFACVELLKPPILMNESSFQIFTRDGTALGKHVSINRVFFLCKIPIKITLCDNHREKHFTALCVIF